MTLNCIIVDDEPLARKVLTEYVEDSGFLRLKGVAENPVRAGGLLESNEVDLMFLDINMPKLSGIEFLRTSGSLPMTIITTAYAEYAIEGFELSAIDYLVKPFSFERFLKAANKAKHQYELRNHKAQISAYHEDYFFVKCEGKIEKIQYNDLLLVEAMLNYIILHTETARFIVYLTIKGIMQQLPASKFLKVHKSYIVNLDKIKSIDGDLINIGAMEIPISQSLYDNVMKAILKDKMIKR